MPHEKARKPLIKGLRYFFKKRSASALLLNFSADMAELADAPDLGSGVYDVQVQVLLSAFFIFSCESTFSQNPLF